MLLDILALSATAAVYTSLYAGTTVTMHAPDLSNQALLCTTTLVVAFASFYSRQLDRFFQIGYHSPIDKLLLSL